MTTSITLPIAALKGMLNIAGKKDIRFYLNGVLVEASAEEIVLAATDGHAAAMFKPEGGAPLVGDDVEFIIPRDVLERVKPVRKIYSCQLVQVDLLRWRLEYAGMAYEFVAVDGKFPDYRRIIPQDASGVAAQFNPELLVKMQKCITGCLGSGMHRLHHNGEAGAIVTGERDNYLGVVMPLREKAVETAEPDVSGFRRPLRTSMKQAA